MLFIFQDASIRKVFWSIDFLIPLFMPPSLEPTRDNSNKEGLETRLENQALEHENTADINLYIPKYDNSLSIALSQIPESFVEETGSQIDS